MAINFELRSTRTKSNKPAPLYCIVRIGDVRCKFRTDIGVSPQKYHNAFRKHASVQAYNDYMATAEGLRVYAQKTTAKGQILTAIADGLTSAEDIAKRVHDALVLDDARKKAVDAAKLQSSVVLPYFDNFIDKMSKGEVKTSKKRNFDQGTQMYYKNTRRYLGAYLQGIEKTDITFNELTLDIADGFINWLTETNIMPSTQKNVLACVRAVCNRAWNGGLIDPAKVGVLDLWKMPTPNENEVRAEVALNESEVDALWDLSNSGTLQGLDQLVVDVCLGGIYSMQRFSDYSRFSKDMVNEETDDKGITRRYLHFIQDKTGVVVDVPLVGRLDKVLARNGYDFTMLDPKTRKWVPKVNYQAFGKRLRNILKGLSVSVPTLCEMVTTNLTHNEIEMEERFRQLLDMKSKGQIKTASAEYYTLLRDCKLQIENGCMGTSYLWKRNAHGQVVREKWSIINSHVCRRSGITIALETGVLSDEQIRKISGHRTLKSFRKYDKRDLKKVNANIFDALQRSEDKDNEEKEKNGAKVLSMAVNQ